MFSHAMASLKMKSCLAANLHTSWVVYCTVLYCTLCNIPKVLDCLFSLGAARSRRVNSNSAVVLRMVLQQKANDDCKRNRYDDSYPGFAFT